MLDKMLVQVREIAEQNKREIFERIERSEQMVNNVILPAFVQAMKEVRATMSEEIATHMQNIATEHNRMLTRVTELKYQQLEETVAKRINDCALEASKTIANQVAASVPIIRGAVAQAAQALPAQIVPPRRASPAPTPAPAAAAAAAPAPTKPAATAAKPAAAAAKPVPIKPVPEQAKVSVEVKRTALLMMNALQRNDSAALLALLNQCDPEEFFRGGCLLDQDQLMCLVKHLVTRVEERDTSLRLLWLDRALPCVSFESQFALVMLARVLAPLSSTPELVSRCSKYTQHLIAALTSA